MPTTTSTSSVTYAVSADGFDIDFCAAVDARTVKTLAHLLTMAFDYYQFTDVNLKLDSPGGDGRAMSDALAMFQNRRALGQAIHVSAGPCCASAAAIMLAHGAWGQRTVRPTSMVLFHTGRLHMQAIELTRGRAATLAQQLSRVDQRLIASLVTSLCNGAGGEGVLRAEMQSRLAYLFHSWDEVHLALAGHDIFATEACTPWLKTLRTVFSPARKAPALQAVGEFKAWLARHLVTRFEEDSAMDLREAYTLCLIDSIDGVLPMQGGAPVNGVLDIDAGESSSPRQLLGQEISERPTHGCFLKQRQLADTDGQDSTGHSPIPAH